MFFLTSLNVTQFKNYNLSFFTFSERIIGICGLNGKGKTNLLDALYYCCFTKSYFSKADGQNTQFDKDGFRIETNWKVKNLSYNTISDEKIVAVYKGISKKDFFVNDVPYQKLSEHIGKFPAVIIAPDDVALITEGSEERRKFLDMVISQIYPQYLHELIIYNKVLAQRNSLLKRFAEQGKTDWPLLEVLDEQLIAPGKIIYDYRKKITTLLIPLVQKYYGQIANNEEVVTLQYDSQLNESDFIDVINACRQKDFLLQRTNGGIHKDEITILLNSQNFKNTASQGQRKSLLFALKLAEFELLKQHKGFAPLLLLDDVFEKLDDVRMNQLLHWVCTINEGQVFITDTHKERLVNAFTNLGEKFQIIEL